MNLRNRVIRLASSFPAGSDERRQLLAMIDSRREADGSRSQKENAVAGKFPPDSKMGKGANRTVMLTGNTAKALGKSNYTSVKLSELSDEDLDKLYALLVK